MQGHQRADEQLTAASAYGGTAVVAVAVATEGQCEIVGLQTGQSEVEVFWTDFLCNLVKRRLEV